MLVDASGTQAISYLGQVDKGAFWVCGGNDHSGRHVEVPGASNLLIHDGRDDFFGVSWQPTRTEFCLAAYRHSNVSAPAGLLRTRLDVAPGVSRRGRFTVPSVLEGDPAVLNHLPRAYVLRGDLLPRLAIIHGESNNVEVVPLSWFEDQYDTQYQSVQEVAEFPGHRELVFSIQRDSRLVVFDPVTNAISRHVELAQRNGGGHFVHRRKAQQLWASDYDTLVCLDVETWKTLGAVRLQGDAPGGGRQFIGDHSFTSDEKFCIVARPYSADVLIVDAGSISVAHRVITGDQPVDAMLLDCRSIIARDRETGNLLKADLQ